MEYKGGFGMYYQNKAVEQLDRIFDQDSREGYLRLDLNENPGGLPIEFIRNVLSDITPEFLSRYPETLEFKETLAEFLGTDIDHICLRLKTLNQISLNHEFIFLIVFVW